ncbi:hypothetical protein AB0C02_06990 [Micromonospora sp. NPDC048999]|uniref:hypothetical protein n=1 Tax=Micromonospora sp. NPDC048999 TaxID=3155391 RepID=UPI0033CC4094
MIIQIHMITVTFKFDRVDARSSLRARRALTAAGIPDGLGLHLHDLRHSGSTWSAQSGAKLKELMAPIRHSSTYAAVTRFRHVAA